MANVLGFAIKNQWINFTLYFPNFMFKTKRNPTRNKFCDWIIPLNGYDRLKSNSQPIGGKQKDTQFLGSGDTNSKWHSRIFLILLHSYLSINDVGDSN
jgi:hypothetical protein